MRAGILKEITWMAVDSLRSNKMRSFLTLLGIMIGVMTVIAMVSVVQGINRSVMSELESIGSDLIIISKLESGIQLGELSEEIRQRKDLTFDDALAIEEECSLIDTVAVQLPLDMFTSVPIKYQNIEAEDALILGMNEQFPEVLTVYFPESGRFLSKADVTHKANVCVLGSALAETLFPHTVALGKELRIGQEKFTVVGVLEERGTIFGQSQDNFVGIPVTTLMKVFPYNLLHIEFITTPNKDGSLQDAMEQIINVLRKRRKVEFGKPNDFSISTQDSALDLYNQITGAVYLVMILISSIGLLVGGIGVMNIMLVSVKERTREIGIRKAIGARSSDILKQFLMEAIFVTGTGGILGILIGFGIAFLIKTATPLPATVTSWSVLVGFSVSVSIGLFFGIIPAKKAANLDPIISLRYE
jgi:putative ABC transport system permease protein